MRKRTIKTISIMCILLISGLVIGRTSYLLYRWYVFQSLSVFYGDGLSMDAQGRFWLHLHHPTATYPFKHERADPDKIHNDWGITAEITDYSIEENKLTVAYFNNSFPRGNVGYGCHSVEKWIGFGWYDVTAQTGTDLSLWDIGYQKEKSHEFYLCLEEPFRTDRPYTGLRVITPGRYRMVMGATNGGTGAENQWLITAEFEIP